MNAQRYERWLAIADALDESTELCEVTSHLLRRVAHQGAEGTNETREIMEQLAQMLRGTAKAMLKTAAEFEGGRLN